MTSDPSGPLDVEALARFANQVLADSFGPVPSPSGSSPASSPLPQVAPLVVHGPPGSEPVTGTVPGTGAGLPPGRSGAPGAPSELGSTLPAGPGAAAPGPAPSPVTARPADPPVDDALTYGFLAELAPSALVAPGPSAPSAPAPALTGVLSYVPGHIPSSDVGAPGGPATPSVFDDAGATSGPSYYFVEPASTSSASGFDAHAVRREFPILSERINGRPLVWLDNAATTQKPRVVIDRITRYYEHENSNVHRAAHTLAARSTDAYEGARKSVARFIGADPAEVVWTRGTTEAINLVANTWGQANIGEGDEIVLSHLEHHANIVPWKMLADRVGAKLKVVPVDDVGQVRIETLPGLVSERTKLIAVAQVSNALGTVVPVEAFVAAARAVGAKVLVDGAQSVAHLAVDVKALDPDFFVFSGHKIFAPTGIGVLYGKAEVLEAMPPWQGGGNMIRDVTFDSVAYADPPTKFEAGTGNIADAVGLGAALDWLQQLGLPDIAAYEHGLLEYATSAMESVPGLCIIGTAPSKASVLSFVLDGWDPIDVGVALDKEGIAVRAGHHCAQPILRRFGHEATVRSSLALYNDHDDVDRFVAVLHRLARRR